MVIVCQMQWKSWHLHLKCKSIKFNNCILKFYTWNSSIQFNLTDIIDLQLKSWIYIFKYNKRLNLYFRHNQFNFAKFIVILHLKYML